jgi:hypothetical protein
MEASGVVRGGADVSEHARGTLTVQGVSGSAGRGPVASNVALRDARVLFGDSEIAEGVAGQAGETLSGQLANAGCAPVQEEVDELVSATEGVLRGPKGTLMSGQTKTLRVLSTAFDR